MLTLCAGCADHDLHDAYADAVADALERPVSRPVVQRIQYPAGRDLRLSVPEEKIDWLQFAQLHSCDLGDLVGRRNSGLGRLATASQRLLYELEFVSRLSGCDEDAADWLVDLTETKRAALPIYWWNALFAGPEFQQAMSMDGPEQAASGAVPLQTLSGLVAAGPGRIEAAALEPLLRDLAGAGFGHSLARWQKMAQVLDAVATALVQRSPPVCLNAKPTPRSRRLLAVFQNYYLPLQARSAQLGNNDRVWLDALDTLAQQFAEPPPVYSMWRSRVAAAWEQQRRSLAYHQQAWQNLLMSCGLTVQDLSPRSRPEI